MAKSQEVKQLLVFSYGLPLLCFLFAWRQHAKHGLTIWVEIFLTLGVFFLFLAVFFPRSIKFVFKYWMKVARLIGQVVTIVILTFFFFLIITPVSILLRVLGKDFMKLSLKGVAESYWVKRENKNEDYTQQF